MIRALAFLLSISLVFAGVLSIGIVLGRIDDNKREIRKLRGEIPRDYLTPNALEPYRVRLVDRDATLEVCRARTEALREAIQSLILVNAASYNTHPGMAWENWPSMPQPKGP